MGGEVKSENQSSFSEQVNLACNTTSPLRLPLKNQLLLEISSRVFLKGRRIPTRLSTCGVNGRLEKRVKKGKGKQEKGKALKCKLVPGGVRKVKAMEKKLKAISKDLKRFSRILVQYSSPGGER